MAFFLPFLAAAQIGGKPFIEPLVQKDTITIADHVEYGVIIDSLEKGSVALFPELQCEGIEFIGDWKLDTLKVNIPAPGDSITYSLRAAHKFTSFDTGNHILPAFNIIVRKPSTEAFDTLTFDSGEIEFMEIPVDTATFKPYPIANPLAYPKLPKPFPWGIFIIVVSSLLVLALVGLLIWYFLRKKAAKNQQKIKDPAYIVALRGLEAFKGASLVDHDKQKAFYSGITDVLRVYIDETYDVSAPEMTTAEIFRALRNKDIPSEMQNRLKELFEMADFVKFAKHMASDMENAGVLPLAVQFVTESYQRELLKEEKQEKEEE